MAGQSDLLSAVLADAGAFDDDALVELASKGLLRRAKKDLQRATPTHQLGADVVEVHLEDAVVSIPAKGPAFARCTCPADRCRHRIAAVLHLRALHGPSPMKAVRAGPPARAEESPGVLAESTGAPRTREEVLASARMLLEEMVDAGVLHPGPAVDARLMTLSTSAIGANLPRLSLELKRIADEVQLERQRHAQANPGRVLRRLSDTYALIVALASAGQSAPAELVGWHRTQYRDIGTIELRGLGAFAWRTASGYVGITVLFREETSGRWLSWAEARPEAYASSEELYARYREPGPWAGMKSPEAAARSHFRLSRAKTNHAGRLSSSSKSTAQPMGESKLAELDLGDRLGVEPTKGLIGPDPLERYAVVRPASFGEKRFDSAAQRLSWPMTDEDGRAIVLTSVEGDATTRALESLDPAGVWGILGSVGSRGDPIGMRPLVIYRERELVSLTLDTTHERAGIVEESEPTPRPTPTRVRRFELLLEGLAESGRFALDSSARARMAAMADAFDRAALPILGKNARALADADSTVFAARLLAARYVTSLHA